MNHYKNLFIADVDGEVWVDIDHYVGLYKVSNFGRVKSIGRTVLGGRHGHRESNDKILKQRTSKKYLNVTLCKNGIKKVYTVHRIVLKSFVKENIKSQINHINGTGSDNRLVNLEWVTPSENLIHSVYILNNKSYLKAAKEAKIKNSKPVIRVSKNGEKKEYNSLALAAKDNNIRDATHISACCRKKIKTSHGFSWYYKKSINNLKK